jgi:metal-responsive CopG/Arc/MetJ family transcriptional regulator
MKKLIVSVALSPDVVTQLDSNRGRGIKISRSSLIENAVRAYLLYLEGSEASNNKKTLTA